MPRTRCDPDGMETPPKALPRERSKTQEYRFKWNIVLLGCGCALLCDDDDSSGGKLFLSETTRPHLRKLERGWQLRGALGYERGVCLARITLASWQLRSEVM
uniref:Uncharacterized protein n=1 Tax=Lotharella globosa TaxID=91324 RepID=A0A7S3Z7A8_9EUKA